MPITINGLPLATYKLEVAWYKTTGGADTAPLWNAADWTNGGALAYVDMTKYVDAEAGLSVTRGKTSALTAVQSGSLTVPILDPTAIFSVLNGSSPLSPHVLPGVGVRLSVTYSSVTSYLFMGWVQRIVRDRDRRGRGQLVCSDSFGKWAIQKNMAILGNPTTTGAALAAVLNAIPWAYQNLDAGITFFKPGGVFLTQPTDDVMTILNSFVSPSGGTFVITGDGTARFIARGASNSSTVQSTVQAAIQSVPVEADLSLVLNEAIVSRTNPTDPNFKPIPQRVADQTSITQYGKRTFSLDSPYYGTDSAALALAQYVVANYKNPINRIRQVTFEARDAATAQAAFQRDVGDRVSIVEARDGTTGTYIIWSVAHNIQARKHSVTWTLAPPGL